MGELPPRVKTRPRITTVDALIKRLETMHQPAVIHGYLTLTTDKTEFELRASSPDSLYFEVIATIPLRVAGGGPVELSDGLDDLRAK